MFKKIHQFIKTVFNQEYAKAGIYYTVANMIGQGMVLFSSAIFTRMMSKKDYGLVSTYSTWVLVFNTFICLNLFVSVRTAYLDFKDDYDNYNSSVLALSIICGVALTAIIAGVTQIFGIGFGIWEVLLACIQSVALNIVNYMLAVQSMRNEYRRRTFMMIAPNWTHVFLSFVLMIIFTRNLYMAKICGNALGLAIFAVYCVVIFFLKSVPKVILGYWRYSLKISVPSIFNMLSDLMLMQCDRLMLTSMAGAEQTAEYCVIYNVSSIIVAIYQAINGAWLPWFFDRLKENDGEKTRKYQEYYMLAFTVFTCGIMTISPELIKMISPRNYWQGIRYVAPIVVSSYLIFLYAFFSVYLLYMQRTVRIAVNTVIAAALNIALNFIWIPQYQAAGAVMATVVSYVVLFMLYFVAVSRDGRRYFSISKMWANILGVTIFGSAFYFVRNIWIVRYGMFLIAAVCIYVLLGRKFIIEFSGERK